MQAGQREFYFSRELTLGKKDPVVKVETQLNEKLSELFTCFHSFQNYSSFPQTAMN